jgi:hypothetical protein
MTGPARSALLLRLGRELACPVRAWALILCLAGDT